MAHDGLFDYFDRIAIIHLPERQDRYRAIHRELAAVGIDVASPKVSIPAPPMPADPNGFPSRGVYGNFLSHLGIIEAAYSDGADSVLVLEDDAMFSTAFHAKQSGIARSLFKGGWDQVFIGHSIDSQQLPTSPSGLVRFQGDFFWAHCYGVHRRLMPRLITYLRGTIEREAGDVLGGKLYIDGAYSLFRRFNKDMVCLLASPRLSIQRGSASSLNTASRLEQNTLARASRRAIRHLRDEAWRHGLVEVHSKAHVDMNKLETAEPWPG
jgi:glycosyl transferase family 25